MVWRFLVSLILLAILGGFVILLLIYVYFDKKRKNNKKIVGNLYLIIKNLETNFEKFFNSYFNDIIISSENNFTEAQKQKIVENLSKHLEADIQALTNFILVNNISEINLEKQKDLKNFANLYVLAQSLLKNKDKSENYVKKQIQQNISENIKKIVETKLYQI